jgi:hypothetical protein
VIEELNEIIETLKGADNEGTESPYWLILDPCQNMRRDPHYLASQITGPFFSRKDAKQHLENRGYEFSSRAVVYCLSGYWSKKYKDLYRKLNATPSSGEENYGMSEEPDTRLHELVSDEKLESSFLGNFVGLTKREVIARGLLKCACGYSQGSTAQTILKRLGLIDSSYSLTQTGREYLWVSSQHSKKYGTR